MKSEVKKLVKDLNILPWEDFIEVIRKLDPDDVFRAFLTVQDSDDQPRSDWVDTMLFVLDEVRADRGMETT